MILLAFLREHLVKFDLIICHSKFFFFLVVPHIISFIYNSLAMTINVKLLLESRNSGGSYPYIRIYWQVYFCQMHIVSLQPKQYAIQTYLLPRNIRKYKKYKKTNRESLIFITSWRNPISWTVKGCCWTKNFDRFEGAISHNFFHDKCS